MSGAPPALVAAFWPLVAQGGGADWGGLIFTLLVIGFGIFQAIRQAMAQGRPGLPPGPRPRRVGPPAGGGQAPADPLAELEAFLRRAAEVAQGRREPPPQAPPPEPQRPRPQQLRPQQPGPGRKRKERRQRPAEPVVEAVEASEGPRPRRKRLGAEVGEHVREHLGSKPFSERAAHLTKLDQADEQMAARVHQAFDHQVGRLSSDAPPAETAAGSGPSVAAGPRATPAAAQIAALLRDPNQVRTAIVLETILRRPTERW